MKKVITFVLALAVLFFCLACKEPSNMESENFNINDIGQIENSVGDFINIANNIFSSSDAYSAYEITSFQELGDSYLHGSLNHIYQSELNDDFKVKLIMNEDDTIINQMQFEVAISDGGDIENAAGHLIGAILVLIDDTITSNDVGIAFGELNITDGVNASTEIHDITLAVTDDPPCLNFYISTVSGLAEYYQNLEIYDSDVLLLPDDLRWGMSILEVKAFETKKVNRELDGQGVTYLSFKASPYDKYQPYIDYVYCFKEDQLDAYWYTFEEDYPGVNYYNVYSEIKEVLVAEYGEPDEEKYNWTDNAYKDNREKWGEAFSYNDFNITTKWYYGDEVILITWDYDDDMTVAYAPVSFEDDL